MVKSVCVFAALTFLAVSANALQCYDCPKGCPDGGKEKWNTTECGPNPAGAARWCLKQEIQMKDTPDKVIRKCVLVNEGKKYECVPNPGENITFCETCQTDLCNSAGSIELSSFIIATMAILLVATRLQ